MPFVADRCFGSGPSGRAECSDLILVEVPRAVVRLRELDGRAELHRIHPHFRGRFSLPLSARRKVAARLLRAE